MFVGVEGEKCVDMLNAEAITAFTFATHCWEEKALLYGLQSLLKIPQFKGFLYITDNDRTGKVKSRKLSNAARKLQLPHQIVSIVDIWFYVVDEICPIGADIADLLQMEEFNLEKLLCQTIIKL